jgi:Mg2+ and Co2+ transporter CorA
MLNIYKNTEQGLERLESAVNGSWVHAVDPTPEEVQKLIAWGMDADYINYSLDQDEMARMEREDEYTFILLRIPNFQGPAADVLHYDAAGLYPRNRVFTVCRYERHFQVSPTEISRVKTGKRSSTYIFLETSVRPNTCGHQ